MSDLGDLAVDSLPAASIFPDSSSSNPLGAVDAWNPTFNAAKLAGQDPGWQPVSPNAWPAQTASQWLPPGGTYDPETDTWERTQGAANTLPNAPTSSAMPSAPPGATFAERFGTATPAPRAGGTLAAAGATAQARHSATRSAGATPSSIDPATLPPGPLNQADYARVGERNRYLASKYDPNNLYDRFINSFTGAMNDPANVRTPSEQAEHEALSQKIIDTVFPQPTVAEARLNMMASSPFGATLSVFAGALGGSQQAQDGFLIAGSTVDNFGLGRGLRAEGPPSINAAATRSSGRPPTKPPAQAPEAALAVPAEPAKQTPANWGTGPLRASARPLLENENVLIGASHGLQSRLPGAGPFQNVRTGTRPDQATKYLWTVDDRGVNIGLEKTPFPTPRGNIVHTNLSEKASIGGEAWFGPENSVTINAGSGRFGDNAGITPQQWDSAIKLWQSLGYRVNPVPFNER
jgi:hypothetical protein